MKILIAGLKNNYHFRRLAEEGVKRGHVVKGAKASELVIYATPESFEPTLRGREMTDYDLIYLMVSKRRWEWYTAALFLKEKYGTRVVNRKVVDPSYRLYQTPAVDYLREGAAGLPFPASAVVLSLKSLDSVLSKFSFPLVVKAAGGRKGKGVFLAQSVPQLEKVVAEVLQNAVSVVLREFIPNDGDIRVFSVGYKAIGAMKRIPKEGEFRSNISLGAQGQRFSLEEHPAVRELAEKAAQVSRTEIAGVDIVVHKETGKPYILEINPAPQFQGLEKYTGINAAEEIIKYFESLLRDNEIIPAEG